MKIHQYNVFDRTKIIDIDNKATNEKTKTAPKKSSYNKFDIQFSAGNNKTRLKDDGIMMLRVLGSKFSKNTIQSSDSASKLCGVLASEIKVKKGILPQNIAVMDALFNVFQKK